MGLCQVMTSPPNAAADWQTAASPPNTVADCSITPKRHGRPWQFAASLSNAVAGRGKLRHHSQTLWQIAASLSNAVASPSLTPERDITPKRRGKSRHRTQTFWQTGQSWHRTQTPRPAVASRGLTSTLCCAILACSRVLEQQTPIGEEKDSGRWEINLRLCEHCNIKL